MKKLLFSIVITIISIILTTSISYSNNYTIIKLSNNEYDNWWPHINSKGDIVWLGQISSNTSTDTAIFLYDRNSSTIIQIPPENGSEAQEPKISDNGNIVWTEWDGSSTHIFLYERASFSKIQLSTKPTWNQWPNINANGDVVWRNQDGFCEDIFLYDNTNKTISQITASCANVQPEINDRGDIVWYGHPGTPGCCHIFLYEKDTAAITQLSDFCNSFDPMISNNGDVVWYTSLGWYTDIFSYDKSTNAIIQLTDSPQINISINYAPKINANGDAIWFGDYDLFLYKKSSSTITRLTDNINQLERYDISDNKIVWTEWDGSKTLIFVYDMLTQITNQIFESPEYAEYIEVNPNGDIIWNMYDGSNMAIFLAIDETDSDKDGVLDPDDLCPNENATGFDVNSDGCIDNITGLETILELLVQEGIIAEELQNSLLSKVENAEKSASKDNICAAINQLTALINQVNAQSGNKISDDAADKIINYTNSVIEYLLSQLSSGQTC